MIKLKVCGMKYLDNILEISKLKPDYMGFIFYNKSSRDVTEVLDKQLLRQLSPEIQKIGVFVNAGREEVLTAAENYKLDAIQLHGNESEEDCRFLKSQGLKVIKAFSIGEDFNFKTLNAYKPVADFFLFDTKGENYGGNGQTFDWNLLKKYDNEKPFFLSGGIDEENVKEIIGLTDLNIYAIDVNSRFETKPAYKNVRQLKKLQAVLKNININQEEQ